MNVSALVSRLQARGSRAASFVSSSRWLSGFVFDLRSLALFRILFGIVILGDLIYRAGFITDFYTDGGVLPRQVLTGNPPSTWWFCAHALSGGVGLQVALFLLTGISVVSMIVGYNTRLATILTWILITSMQARNPAVLQGGDDIVRVMLFWSIFAPLGSRCSIDRIACGEGDKTPNAQVSLGASLLALQLCLVYWFSGLLKLHPVWYSEGSAAYYALSLQEFTKPAGTWLLQFYPLLRFVSFATLGVELIFPTVVFLPFLTGWFRGAAVFGFTLFHLGLFVTMYLGAFPWQCMACWTLFLPSGLWDRLALTERGASARCARLERAFRKLPQVSVPYATSLPSIVAAVLMVGVVLWNIAELPRSRYEAPAPVQSVLARLGLQQNWGMFAPFPYRVDGWLIVEGVSKDETHVDMWNERSPVSFDTPPSIAATYRNYMWRKYLTNMYDRGYGSYPASFARYLCRRWNSSREGSRRIREVSIYHMAVRTPLPAQSRPQPKKEVLWQDVCPEGLGNQ